MSALRPQVPSQEASQSAGSPSHILSREQSWQTFVKIVVEITVDAYHALCQRGGVKRHWEEDVFTINLEDEIRPLAQQHLPNLNVKTQIPVYTQEMRRGESSPKEANRIDIQIWDGSWRDYDKQHFVWECKLISDKLVDPENAYLTPKYISGGIYRFMDGQYSSEVNDAGMLGYVLAGDVVNIVDDINRSILNYRRKRAMSQSDLLKPAFSFDTYRSFYEKLKEKFADTYLSVHSRDSKENIRLHHLFLTFLLDATRKPVQEVTAADQTTNLASAVPETMSKAP